MQTQPPRQALGTFFRALLDFVDERGLRAQILAQVSPATKAAIENPPRPLAFMPSAPIDEVEVALGRLAGTEALVEAGLVSSRALGLTLIQPVIKAAFFLFGQSAEPVFSNLDRFFSLAIKGIVFSWEKLDRGGTVLARFAGEGTPTAAFHVLRGTLQFVFEVSGTKGEVDPPEIVESTDAGATVRYRVRFE